MSPQTADNLRQLLAAILPGNAFYAHKFAAVRLTPADIRSLDDFARLPCTTKSELLADQAEHPPYGTGLTYPLSAYCRYNQTSGTSGKPLRWLDTAASWQRMLACWHKLFAIAAVTPSDRLFFAFSFGPFLGFWTAFEAACQLGCLCLPGGGLSSTARLRFLLDNAATVVLCTPTYALRLAEVAAAEGIAMRESAVRALIVAGEPGGSIPATRARIEQGWGARVFDHSGLTEVGPMAIECSAAPGGLHVLDEDYLVEVVEPHGGAAVAPGTVGEMIVTNFGRWGSPLLRYRTGDLVCLDPAPCPCGRALPRLKGGILGRVDGMLHIRGNNVYPSALEDILRGFAEIAEYRLVVDESRALAELRVEIEPAAAVQGDALAERVSQAIRERLLFRAEVVAVPPSSLPRYEMKANRVVRSY